MEEHVRSKKEKRTFNVKLQEMQGNLQHVEQERHSLQRAKEQLEQEKKAIQKELQMREKEVTSLVRRCQMQDEKMREAAQIRCNNNDLATQVEGLRSSLTMREEEISSIDALKQKLEDCHQEREELLERLARVKRDHDDVVDTLNDCFKSMQKLQEKQQTNDEDRQRDVQRAELKLEKQRLAYQETIGELKAEIQKRHERIEQMEAVLRDNMAKLMACLVGVVSELQAHYLYMSSMQDVSQLLACNYIAQAKRCMHYAAACSMTSCSLSPQSILSLFGSPDVSCTSCAAGPPGSLAETCPTLAT